MSDEELRHKKESDAEMAQAEAFASEEEEIIPSHRCFECRGQLAMVRRYNPTVGRHDLSCVCRDCGMEIKIKEK